MGRPSSTSLVSQPDPSDPQPEPEFDCPFLPVGSLTQSDLRETAYEIFFMSCRSSPGFGSSRNSSLTHLHLGEQDWPGSPGTTGPKGGTMMVVNSKIKKALGLKVRGMALMRTMNQTGETKVGSSSGRVKRPMTSMEIMRQQMRVSELSDNRLRKTLMRSLVGQTCRKAETIILPLELLRHLKASEFSDAHEYHQWQRLKLRILEAGLLLHPSVQLDKPNSATVQLREVLKQSELKPIDTSKNSEAMRNLCSSVVSLAWRSPDGSTSEMCHWADGYPLNVRLYLALLQSIFDLREETVVLDEVDELVELIKKTWGVLGLSRMIHNLCFAWVLFHQYIMTGQTEPDFLRATVAMLVEVGNDAKMFDCEGCYVKVVSATLAFIQGWAEKKLINYHESFDRGTVGTMESILSLALSTTKIINEDVSSMEGSDVELMESDRGTLISKVDGYIRSSMRYTFNKILERRKGIESMIVKVDEDPCHALVQLAEDTEALIQSEKETFSLVLRKWHPIPSAVAVATLHNCFGILLKQYLTKVTALNNEVVRVLQSAGKLEKALIQMVDEDSVDSDDAGKRLMGEMVPYEVDLIITGFIKTWIEERLRIGNESLDKAKETESWIPSSKSEPYAQSAVDLMKLAKAMVNEFFKIPVSATEEMTQKLAKGLESIFQDYIAFVASCGTKQHYLPPLPPLTRCNQDSKFTKLWRKAKPTKSNGADSLSCPNGSVDGHHPRPSTSRGTQRLYIRLNTLYYLHSHIHPLQKSLSQHKANYFDFTLSTIQSAIHHVSEVAAYRLIFLDSTHTFYNGLYESDIESSRIPPALRILKQNLTSLVSILTERAQSGAVKEVMKASFEAFLMVLLAGGSERAFARSDYSVILEDFRSLKRLFCTSGEGLVAEEVVDREAEVVEGIIALMALPTERLIEEFSSVACEASGVGRMGSGRDGPNKQRVLPMPPTTARWNKSDPNTVLRVLCHRNDDAANLFLKKTFQLPKRK